jgi:hypothetical protein
VVINGILSVLFMPLYKKCVQLLILFLLILMQVHAEAKEAKFIDVLITSNTDQILVYAQVSNCFTKDTEDAILAGVPTTFTFLFEVYAESTNWWDEKILQRVIQHTIKYDNVKKVFQVSSTHTNESITFQTFDGAKKAMADLNGIMIIQVKDLSREKSYYLRMKAKLEKIRLPLHMEYLFFFVSLWDFETDWHVQRVIY